eukprot:gnl/TRDRNA2_/TRDRNA2_137799_c0_seq1.p2 gnl/TRDRNA2_/TRDRNA2_137799_c0~~gnl/TRDRNA2_/TRDRNA2_137799_c0_seq1.p2  ORF type:complete len:114 (+),score=18.15 gnl/TRDRNA2_/TRDRNA2_137799_c0_seq1:113-454(+)
MLLAAVATDGALKLTALGKPVAAVATGTAAEGVLLWVATCALAVELEGVACELTTGTEDAKAELRGRVTEPPLSGRVVGIVEAVVDANDRRACRTACEPTMLLAPSLSMPEVR